MNLGQDDNITEGKQLLSAVVGILTKVCEAKETGIATEKKTETGTVTETEKKGYASSKVTNSL